MEAGVIEQDTRDSDTHLGDRARERLGMLVGMREAACRAEDAAKMSMMLHHHLAAPCFCASHPRFHQYRSTMHGSSSSLQHLALVLDSSAFCRWRYLVKKELLSLRSQI